MKPVRRRVLGGLVAAAAVAGCGLMSPRAIRDPPSGFDRKAPHPPVVFIHGAFGSKLAHRASGREIWPVGTSELLLSNYAALELPLDPDTGEALPDDIEPTGVFEEAGNLDFYGSLLEALARAGGYRRAVPGTPVDDGQPRQYAYLYDWRRDFVEAAQGLGAFIERIQEDHGDPDLAVDIVAHSSGGFLARYFLMYGDRPLAPAGPLEPDFAGAAKVRRVVAIGVPELGMARAVESLAYGETIGLNRIWPSVLATAHAPFQLLPHGDDSCVIGGDGKPLPLDLYDVEVWRKHRLSVFDPLVRERVRHESGGREGLAQLELAFAARLVRARRVRDALRAEPLPRSIPYFVIAGDCRATLARLVLERHGERSYLRSTVSGIQWPQRGVPYPRLMLEDGDGTVTKASARGRPRMPAHGRPRPATPINPRGELFVCASHNQLAVNNDCQRALLQALGG